MAMEKDNNAGGTLDGLPILLTGLQPTAGIHLGNYLGALQNWVAMQRDHRCLFFISDMHAITVPGSGGGQLRKTTMDCAAFYLACGIDPEKSCIFIQSQVFGHAELAWVLGCLASVGQLERMTQFKDKSGHSGGFIGAGLLYYPILMAADILLYNAKRVPVGEDQRQHLELARDLAEKFNGTYGAFFNVPEAFVGNVCARVMSLQNPLVKMSKSDENTMGALFLMDSNDKIQKKIRTSVTDSEGSIRISAEKPGISNLLHIFSGISGDSVSALEERYAGVGYGQFKADIADAIIEKITPIRERFFHLRREENFLANVLEKGRIHAQGCALSLLDKVYDLVGFQRRFTEE
ncbi:MAG: tryptophan--tRNA ligase [Puniceicoccales bacterium]|jgi:tryptophanyl-tRNA synthetase|nr:tryptophan--tRNA ligase [Puniceicoccales bacterium]